MGLINNVNVNVGGNGNIIDTLSTYVTKLLKPNIVDGKNVLTQDMMSAANTKYVIKYDYVLSEDITVPADCVLEFDGGSISASGGNDTIIGQNTGIEAGLVKIFNINVTLAGTWNVAEAYPEWFGAKGDGVHDDTIAIQTTIYNYKGYSIAFTGDYCVNAQILVETSETNSTSIHIYPTSSIKATASIDSIIKYEYADISVSSGGSRNKWRAPMIYGGGTLSCNGLAARGLWLKRYRGIRVHDIKIVECANVGLQLGESNELYTNEGVIESLEIYTTLTNNSIGILNYGNDVKLTDITIYGCKTAIENHRWMMLKNLHACVFNTNYEGSILIKLLDQGELDASLVYNDNYQTAYYIDTTASLTLTDCLDQWWMDNSIRANYNNSITFLIKKSNPQININNYNFRNALSYQGHKDVYIDTGTSWIRMITEQLARASVVTTNTFNGVSVLRANNKYYKTNSSSIKYLKLGRLYLLEDNNKGFCLDIKYAQTGAYGNSNEFTIFRDGEHPTESKLMIKSPSPYKNNVFFLYLSPAIADNNDISAVNVNAYDLYVRSSSIIDGYFKVSVESSSALFAPALTTSNDNLDELPGDYNAYKIFITVPQLIEKTMRDQYDFHNLIQGTETYDTMLNKIIIWNGTAWVDATGATV